MTAQFLYCTAPDVETADKIARRLVSKGQAACVNILPEMRSVYKWQGEIEQAVEAVFIVKTTAEAANNARETILNWHPYDCPCILALPVDAINSAPAFLEWIETETKQGTKKLATKP